MPGRKGFESARREQRRLRGQRVAPTPAFPSTEPPNEIVPARVEGKAVCPCGTRLYRPHVVWGVRIAESGEVVAVCTPCARERRVRRERPLRPSDPDAVTVGN